MFRSHSIRGILLMWCWTALQARKWLDGMKRKYCKRSSPNWMTFTWYFPLIIFKKYYRLASRWAQITYRRSRNIAPYRRKMTPEQPVLACRWLHGYTFHRGERAETGQWAGFPPHQEQQWIPGAPIKPGDQHVRKQIKHIFQEVKLWTSRRH